MSRAEGVHPPSRVLRRRGAEPIRAAAERDGNTFDTIDCLVRRNRDGATLCLCCSCECDRDGSRRAAPFGINRLTDREGEAIAVREGRPAARR